MKIESHFVNIRTNCVLNKSTARYGVKVKYSPQNNCHVYAGEENEKFENMSCFDFHLCRSSSFHNHNPIVFCRDHSTIVKFL